MTKEDIIEKLIEAKDAYYNSDAPIMSDNEFDLLEDELKKIDPENSYFKTVGSESRTKIKHSVPMLSMQKAKTVDELAKWIEKLALDNEAELCIQPKIDGLSATCCYENGKLLYIATRGDGSAGQDISHISEYIDSIPKSISFTLERIEVRGELYLPKNTKFDTQGRPLRNNCVGLINRKENYGDLQFVDFAAFQIIAYAELQKESECFDVLKESGFFPVTMKVLCSISEIDQYYTEYLARLRESWLYETDGLVVTVNDRSLFEEIDSRWIVDHHHHYACALKPPSEAKETTLLKIDWQVSRQGNVIPVAVFEPVYLGGAKTQRASLSNFDTIKKMKIQVGDTLLIERANDVIPYVRENISAASRNDDSVEKIELCPSCSSKLTENGVHLRCINRECPETNIQKILFWVKSSGIEQIAEATIRTLYNKGLVSKIADLYTLTSDKLAGLEGFAEKKTQTLLSEVQNSRKMSARDLIAKLGIPLVQKKALDKLSIYSVKDFLDFADESYIIGQNLIAWKEDSSNKELFDELVQILDIVDEKLVAERKKVCMTGKGPTGRKELISQIEAKGFEFVSTVTKETDVLLTDDPEGSSSKIQKAKKFGVKITSYDEFLG